MTNTTDPRVEAAIDAVIKARGWRDSCWGDGAIGGFDYSNEEQQRHVIRDHEAEEREGRTVILFETEDYEEYQSEFRRACIRREVSAALQASDAAAWQPIESAPHNQKVTLGWRKLDGKWQQAFDMASYDWKCGDYASGISRHSKATHWMPLPMPPEATP